MPPQYGAPAPFAPKVNPFHGWPISDYIRDAAAAFCLFAVLGMSWSIGTRDFEFGGSVAELKKGGDQWWVIIGVLLAVLSLAVPYLAKSGAVPAWTGKHYHLLKLGLNIPLAAGVLAAVINELIHVGDLQEGLLGTGVGMALAGMALAIQPRAAEETADHSDDRLWLSLSSYLTYALLGLSAVMTVTWILYGAIADEIDLFDDFTRFLALLFGLVLTAAVGAMWPAFSQLGGAPSWRRVFVTVAFTLPVIALFAGTDNDGGWFFSSPGDKWYGFVGAPPTYTLLLGAAGALAVSRARLRQPDADPIGNWVRTASSAMLVSAALSALTVVGLLFAQISFDFSGSSVTAMILSLAAAGIAGFSLTLLSRPAQSRVMLLGLWGGLIVVGLVLFGIINSSDAAAGVDTGWAVAAWVTLPALAIYGLTVPPPVRQTFGPLVTASPAAPAAPQPPYPGQTHPGQTYPGQAQPPAPPAPPQAPPAAPGQWQAPDQPGQQPPPPPPPPGWAPPPPPPPPA
ncbi:hypothetical protein [Nocardioides sp. R-C-SC26]|uniref:DUF7937 domain-containing protein n=1 Tax=Nocardioides sp. R-C-SC26 TaxID=2870414 RepID=UPI001E5B9C21|nr:hypothetical protein [Nocardioides sp. R-C-SC26]